MNKDREMHRSLLLTQLLWFIRLRFIAGGTVVLFAVLDALWLRWYGRWELMLTTGIAILIYNLLMLRAASRLVDARQKILIGLAWAQILFDLACLTLLTTWTGAIASPLMGFYVFHMIFASLLLPRRMAYAGVGVAIAMVTVGLWLAGTLPAWNADQARLAAGWIASLLLTVYLANRITRALRRQRHRLLKQNRHIRKMSRKMHRQQDVMMRQEKMAALGHMAAGITHEIANPLASMDTLLQVMQRKPERVSDQSLQTLRTQVARINEIVRQMTTFAHPGHEHWEVLPINSVIESALEMLRFDKRLARVQVRKEMNPAAGSARVMPHAMHQVLINLIANALDAMAEVADPALTIRTGLEGGRCVIQIADNGHGIRPEHLQRLFEPFFTTKPVGKGTGVGLSITYSLVHKQRGDIGVESQPGHGATFTVRLPAEPERQAPLK